MMDFFTEPTDPIEAAVKITMPRKKMCFLPNLSASLAIGSSKITEVRRKTSKTQPSSPAPMP